MFTCKVINIFSNNSAYVVQFKTRKEVSAFVQYKEADEYVDHVEVKPPPLRVVIWEWFEQLTCNFTEQ